MKHSPRRFAAALVAGVVLSTSSLFAQIAAPEAGLIGKRYAGADFAYDHFTGSSLDKAMGAAAVVNLPLSRSVDLGLGYSYSDASGPNADAIDKALSASLLTHRLTEYGAAYFAGTIGQAWNHFSAFGRGAQNNGAFWGVRAGYEIPVAARSAVNLGIGYGDAFDRTTARAQVVRYGAAASHWFSRDLAGVVSVNYLQIKESPDAISYTAGLRWAF